MPPTSMPHVRQKLLMGLAPRKPALRIVVLFAAFSALGEVFVSLVCSVFEMRLPMGLLLEALILACFLISCTDKVGDRQGGVRRRVQCQPCGLLCGRRVAQGALQ